MKLWNIRTSDCESDFPDSHGLSKIWALDTSCHGGATLFTSGADGSLTRWSDNSGHQVKRKELLRQYQVLSESEINTLARTGKLGDALKMSLMRNRPSHLRRLLETLCSEHLNWVVSRLAEDRAAQRIGMIDDAEDNNEVVDMMKSKKSSPSTNPNSPIGLEEWILSLDDAQLAALLNVIVQWNANGRTEWLANALMAMTLKALSPERLMKLDNLPSLAQTFSSYNSRHSNRLRTLVQRSFIVDFILNNSTASESRANEKENFLEDAILKRRRPSLNDLPSGTESKKKQKSVRKL
eukprot:Selendium_serpulae@DN6042_c0_g1_i2.p1